MGARRAVVTLSATAGALVLLASFHTSTGSDGLTVGAPSSTTAIATTSTTEPATTAPVGTPATATAPPPPSTATSSTAAPRTAAPPTAATSPPVTQPHPTTTTVKAKTVAGPAIGTPYGDVQVQAVIRGTRLVDVQALVLPSDRAHSRRLSSEAEPLLRSEALQAQSAHIDLLSGATYTSEGYAESLQGALDAARA